MGDLVEKVKQRGYEVSRSAVYLRLIPRKRTSHHGKDHVYTMPVKLLKPQKNARIDGISTRFCRATCRNIEELVSILGPSQVVYLGLFFVFFFLFITE